MNIEKISLDRHSPTDFLAFCHRNFFSAIHLSVLFFRKYSQKTQIRPKEKSERNLHFQEGRELLEEVWSKEIFSNFICNLS